MGELFVMNQPRRRSPLPATLGILGSSKGDTYIAPAVGSGSAQPQPGVGTGQAPPGQAPAVGPVDPNQVASVLNTLNTIANPEPPQKITATGEAIPGAAWKASSLPRWVRPSPPPPPPVVYVQPPPVYVTPGVAPGPAFPGGGGGGGGAAADDQGAAAGDAPIFLGMTQTQLVIAGGVGLVAFLLLRKKKRPDAAGEGV